MSSLWSDARFTIVPESSTGSRLATGVIMPMRPTSNDTNLRRVTARSAGNLYAMAHRGDLAVKPRLSCWRMELTLNTRPSVATGRLRRSVSQWRMKLSTSSSEFRRVIIPETLNPQLRAATMLS